MKKGLMVRLPADMVTRLRAVRDREQLTLTAIVYQALRQWLYNYDRRKGAKL